MLVFESKAVWREPLTNDGRREHKALRLEPGVELDGEIARKLEVLDLVSPNGDVCGAARFRNKTDGGLEK